MGFAHPRFRAFRLRSIDSLFATARIPSCRSGVHRSLALVGVLIGFGAGLPAAANHLHLDPVADPSPPRFEILSSDPEGVTLVFDLPVLEIETYDIDGETYQTLAIPGGQLHGAPGEPCLPAFTRLVAIPERAGTALRVIAIEEETLDGIHLLPMQDLEGDTFRIDRSAYEQDAFLGGETVSVGTPALLRDLRVVPLTFRPVRYNPVTGEVRVARRVTLEIAYAGVDLRNSCERARIESTPAVDRLCGSLVLNYGTEENHPRSDAPHLGTWVCIAQDNSTVLDYLQPLVAWRQRMGYNAMLVTTSETGSSSSAIAAWLQDAYDTWEYPPEYVVIVGDCNGTFPISTFHETWSGCSGEGDHPFVEFAGEDLMPDAFIGRLSATTYSSLQLIVNKIVGYESAPDISDTEWFGRACLVGDPDDSGPTCVHVQQWLKERLREIGYTDIDTVFNSPFEYQIRNSLNQGATFFGYRGFWGMSGWGNGDISSLTNGWKMVFAINLTCGTGMFEYYTSTSEAWIRAGSPPDNPTAGVGAIATATECTHTRFNNCYYYGATYGLFWEDHYQFGPAQARAKLEMILNYGEVEYSQAGRYIYWNNLIGDPATELWTGYPEPLQVSHPSSVAIGANMVTIDVRDDAYAPLKDAWVYLYKEGQIAVGGYTDALGSVALPIDTQSPGTVLVTVTGHNLHPYLGSLTIEQQEYFIGLGGHTIDDDGIAPSDGNDDGIVNPGERIELGIALTNFGTQDLDEVELEVSCDDPNVGLQTAGPISYGMIEAGDTAPPPQPVIFSLYPGVPDGHAIRFDLSITAGPRSWEAFLDLSATGADLAHRQHYLDGCGEILDPGENANLVVQLRNDGGRTATAPIDLFLMSESYSVRVTDPYGSLNDPITPGNWRANWDDRFSIAAPSDCIPGLLANLRMQITFADGTMDTAAFVMTVGTGSSYDPSGPDAYGYLCYDDTDTAYPEAPTYAWVEINPNNGGPGQDVGLADFGSEQDDYETIDLPFTFTFYGREFDRATICSNGWMAMGSTYLVNYRNWYMPSAGGPANMLAPFWDNLYQYGSGRVCQWYDQPNHRFIVAWDNVRNSAGGAYESCEVILYDPAYYPTDTGDGVIVFQFEDFNDTDGTQMFSTTGIQNGDHTIGLTYNYYRRHPETAAPLIDGRAIKFTTGGPGASDANSQRFGPQPVYLLLQNEPNPCRGETQIRFTLDHTQPVTLRLFDIDGRLVRTLVQGTLPSGLHSVAWEGRDTHGAPLPAGIYYYQLMSSEASPSRPLLLLR